MYTKLLRSEVLNIGPLGNLVQSLVLKNSSDADVFMTNSHIASSFDDIYLSR